MTPSDFDSIKPGSVVLGLDAAGPADIVQVSDFGPDAKNIAFRAAGRVGERLLYRGGAAALELVKQGRSYAFDADGNLLRLTKEELYRFDGTLLFPERRAYTASYALSPVEADLYQAVTTYVREEMNRADRTGDDKRRSSVGFAAIGVISCCHSSFA